MSEMETTGKAPRIVSLLSSVTELLFALDVDTQLVGTSHECDYPAGALEKTRVTGAHVDATRSSSEIDDSVRDQLETRQSLYRLDVTTIRDLAPDVIITQAQCEVCAIHYDEVVELVRAEPALRDTQILALHSNTWDQVFQDMVTVGDAIGCRSRVERLVESYQERIRSIAERLETAAVERPRVICVEWIDPLMVSGNWVPTLVEKAGGRHGISDENVPSQYYPWSRVQEFDPEFLVVCPCGFDVERSCQELHLLKDLPGWRSLSAVRDDRVVVLDGNAYLNRSGPRLVETVEILAHLMHPEWIDSPVLPVASGKPWYHWKQDRA